MSIRTNVPSSPARATSRATFSYADLLVEGEAEVRELERDVRLQLLGDEALDDRLVLVGDGGGALGVGDRLAEQRRVRVQPRVVEPAQHADALVEGLAGDEAARADPPAVALHEPLQSRAVGRVQDRGARQRGDGCAEVAQARASLPRSAPRQFRDGSGGIDASTEKGPPFRRSTALQSPRDRS